MTHMPFSLANTITHLPWVRAHTAKAVALAVIAMPLPALGHSPDIGSASHPVTARIANAPPVAVSDHVDLKSATQAFNVLANDTDADHDALTIVAASAKFGAVAFTTDGLIAYAANPGAPTRADEISYVVSDGRGGLSTGKVIVSVG